MDNRRKHTKRVFAMLLAIIMCLSQAVTAAADEVSANETIPETVSEESTPEETVSEEAAPEEPEEAVSGEAVPEEPEEAAGEEELVSGNFKYKVSENGSEVIITGHKDGTSATGDLVIPNSINGLPVTVISDNAFKDCFYLTGSLTIPGSVKMIGDQAFYGCLRFTGDLTIPGSVETIGEDAFFSSGFKGKLTIGDGVKTIGEEAFLSCSGFTGDLVIPDSVESIGDLAFKQCSGFNRNLVIGNGVETIGREAFFLCSGFTGTISIGSSVKMIDGHAFKGCNKFTGNLVIPDSVESIGEEAFYGWMDFTGSLTIGKGVKKTGINPFDNWYKASAVTNNSSVTDMLFSWFWDYNDSETVCFLSDNGTEITKKVISIETGTYVRKVKPSGVSLDRTALDVSTGTSKNLTACVSPANAYDKVSWNSSDKSVATVSDGVITGIKPGNAIITVTTEKGGLSASCNVTVSDKSAIQVTGVSLDKSALNMYPGETETLTATVAPADAADRSVRWFSSNEKVATVDNGKITSVSPGSAVITVSTNDGGFKATCAVRVYTKATAHKVIFKDGETVLYTQTVENGKQATDPGSPSKTGYIFIGWSDGTSIWNFTTPVNKDLTLIAKYKAEQAVVSENTGSGMDPTPVVDEPEKKGEKTAYKLYLVKGQTFTAGGKGWTTSDKTIANVAANTGKITAKGKGTAIVTNDTTEYTVYVATPSVSKNSKTVTVLVGQSAEVGIDLQAVEGKENKYPITWYCANPKVAAVNGGMVTGIAKGSAKVTAYIGGKAYSATVKVIDTCKAPSKIKENKAEFSMNPLQSFNVKFDSNVFTIKNATWSGDGMAEVKNKSGKVTGYENKVINITTAGKFTAIGPGTTTVTGTDKNSKTVTVTVTVVPISTKGMAYITKDKTETIKFPKVTNSKADSWKSSNENAVKFATTKKDGKVKGVGCGMSNISCVYKGFTFTTPVYVEDPGMVFGGREVKNKEKFEMKIGEMKQFKVNNTYQTLNYKSSKQANVFVDENGFVYARKKGKANISTKINGKTYQITIDVKE